MSSWGPEAFRGVGRRGNTRARTRRVLATIWFAVLAFGIVLLIVFSAAGRGTDEVMVAVGAGVATVASFASVRVVQGALAYREKPRLDALRERQAERRGFATIPAPLERIGQEIGFAATSRRYYRRVVAPRLRRLAASSMGEGALEDRIEGLAVQGWSTWDRLPERITRRGVALEGIAGLVTALEAGRQGESGANEAPPNNGRGER